MVYDKYYDTYQKKQSRKGRINKSLSLSSVKVLKICTAINEELTQKRKIVVLIKLLEFIKSEGNITEQELEFVQTVGQTFNLPEEDYNQIRHFVLEPIENIGKIEQSENILLIDNNQYFQDTKTRHIYSEFLKGQIAVLSIPLAKMHVLKYVGENELVLNGQLIQLEKVFVLNIGSSIRDSKIRPIYYNDIISAFIKDQLMEKTVLEAKNIKYRFKEGTVGLQQMNFKEESGKLIGIMGASGAGKSTLVNVLNGSFEPSIGKVYINGIDIYEEKEKIEGLIGYVSQDDLLIEDLTVFENLYYNAKLCFGNLSEFQIIKRVSKLLQTLGLFEIKDMKVGSPLNKKISGGQRKRLNIALELIREPAILFLDEPTSGLSSRDSENIMVLLKELALKGKLVVTVIHQPSSDIFKMFDKLIILDVGGYLIYYGDPVDSIIYFKSRTHQANWSESECHCCGNVNPEQIFNIVESQVLDELGNFTKTRRVSPKEWNNQFYKYEKELIRRKTDIPDKLPKIFFKIPNKIRQFAVFLKRDVLSKLANAQYLLLNLFESPLLAVFLAYIIKYYNVDATNEYGYNLNDNSNLPVYMFMSVIVAIFVGLTVSAEEIFKDRKILKRESFLNLSWGSYLTSKVVILFIISAFQALTFIIIGNYIIEIRGMYWEYWLVLFSAWCFANLLGLNISDSFNSAVTIYILIPFLVIPQIILSGIIVKFDKLNPDISSPSRIPIYGEIMTARWAYEALAVYQFKENKYEKPFYGYDKIMSISNYKKDYWLKPINNKVNACKKYLDEPEKKEKIIKYLELLRYELKKESETKSRKTISFDKIDSLYYDKLTVRLLNELSGYLDILRLYYIKKYNIANQKKDKKIAAMQNTPEKKEKFINLKRQHHNETLKEFVRNENDLERIVEYNNRLVQKIDPVFKDPESNFIKAHFYAPRKKLFGHFMDTFWVNIIVIWAMTLFLYITLYFRGMRRLLEFIEFITGQIIRKLKPA